MVGNIELFSLRKMRPDSRKGEILNDNLIHHMDHDRGFCYCIINIIFVGLQMTILHKKIYSNELDSIEQRLGTIQYAIMSSIYSMATDGMHFETLISLRECIDAITCTIWNICSVTTTGALNKDVDELIIAQKKQLDHLYTKVNEMFDYCEQVRNSKKMEIN
jgi:hypothetical protein